MSDLISRQDAIDIVRRYDKSHMILKGKPMIGAASIVIELEDLPSAEAVEVVRCGECKHMIADGRCMKFADDGIRPSAADFCSYGERKGGDDE